MTAAAAPVATADAVRETVLAARDARTTLRIAGRGAWLDAGHPVRAEQTLSVAALTGIIDYVPGDLTLTARAGTRLDEIAGVLGAERQWLPLDAFGPAAGTLGATVATASAGPLAHAFGTPRDNVLGLEAVTGAGAVVRAGGRVVKNVAGFDLVRLFTGSWGTLGVLTEVTVRVRALPEADETFALALPDEEPPALAPRLRELRNAPLAPYAMEMVNAALAARLGIGDTAAVLVRLAGNEEAVRAQRGVLERIGAVDAAPASVWATLRGFEPPSAIVLRFSRRPAELATLWNDVHGWASPLAPALAHASVGRGVLRCVLPATGFGVREQPSLDVWFPTQILAERAPERLGIGPWGGGPPELFGKKATTEEMTAWERGATRLADRVRRLRLERRVKDTFDPMHILNPGILGEAIA